MNDKSNLLESLLSWYVSSFDLKASDLVEAKIFMIDGPCLWRYSVRVYEYLHRPNRRGLTVCQPCETLFKI